MTLFLFYQVLMNRVKVNSTQARFLEYGSLRLASCVLPQEVKDGRPQNVMGGLNTRLYRWKGV